MKLKGNFWLLAVLLSLLVFIFPAAGRAETAWNVAVLDRLLAASPSDQAAVRVGDMVLSRTYLEWWRHQLAGGPAPKIAFDGNFQPWTGGNVFYSFSNNVSAIKQRAFLDGAAEWATFANLHFIARTTETNYVTISEDPLLAGGQSMVGMVGGQQFLQIGPGAWNRSTICHELGHTLGLIHEHQRSDRDSYVTILTGNILAGQEGNFVLLTNSLNQSAYDFLSIMHYSRNNFSANSFDTMEPLPTYAGFIDIMGQRFDPVLSSGDRAGMAAIYGAAPPITNIVTNTRDGGAGSLRAALYYAFDHPGTTISFNLPTSDVGFSNNVFNIQPSAALPGLWGQTTLDGGTQPASNPNGPSVLLDGALNWPLMNFASGLRFRGTNSIVRSLVINNFPYDGILIDGTNTVGNVISGCYLGIDPTGAFPVTNGYVPIEISGGAVSNTVGGTTASARNVISGSGYQGISLHGAGTSFNVVAGNYIGLNPNGTAALSNTWEGIQIWGGARSNLVGGYTASARNIISGNGLQGVAITDPGTGGNTVAGNFIGLNAGGTAAVSNGWSGVEIYGADANAVGPSNVLSGNGNYGVVIFQSGATGNLVQGNLIGLAANGAGPVANNFGGVGIFSGAQSNLVGGRMPAAQNVISGNAEQGVVIGYAGSEYNRVVGNYIGVDPAGLVAMGNGWAGANCFGGAANNIIGGTLPGEGNVISGNHSQGVLLQDAGTSGNLVQGNLVGLNAMGSAAVSNSWSGVEIYNGAANNLVGGYGGARNFISGNGNYGVYIDFNDQPNVVRGNTIGLDAGNGTVIPNGFSAVAMYVASSNLIGGVGAGDANLIAGSLADGVQVLFDGSTNNTIRGNSIFHSASAAILLYSGGNHNLAAPTIASVVVTTNTVVAGNYAGASGQTYWFDFYADAPPAETAQAMTHLGTMPLTGTGAAVAFSASLGVRLSEGRVVSATVTDAAGNTSPLSAGVAVAMLSTPNDGIPDAWRAQYFGGTGAVTNSQSASWADPDHDGASNYEEFLGGTNPTNGASVFRMVALNPRTSTNAVSLESASGFVYRVSVRDDVAVGAWSILADQVIGSGTNLLFYDPAAAVAGKRFYRAQVLW